MADWVAKLGADTGIFAAPEGGATAAAVPILMENGYDLLRGRGGTVQHGQRSQVRWYATDRLAEPIPRNTTSGRTVTSHLP